MTRLRFGAHATTLALILAAFALGAFRAPCADWIDGPCAANWASDAQWLLLPLLVPSLGTSLVLLLRDGQQRARRAFWSAGDKSWTVHDREHG